MLKIFRNLQLISKDDFDQALYLCTSSEDTSVPKQKHIQPILQCLLGNDRKILPLDAFNRFYDLLLQVTYNKWITALKVAYLLHYCLDNQCNVFIEAVCINQLYDKIRNKPTKKPDDPIASLHLTFASIHYSYLQNRYENYLYFQNALSDFNQKQDYQKTFIVHKMVQSVQLLVRAHKEIDISIEKFPQITIMKHILLQLLSDLTFFYPKIQEYLIQKLPSILELEPNHAEKLYQVYTETLRMSRAVSSMMKLLKEIPPGYSIIPFTLFTIDQAQNKEIELHFKNAKRVSPKQLDIIRFDDESLHDPEEQITTTPPKLLQSFQTMVASRSHIQIKKEPEPDQIEYKRTNPTPKTERRQPPQLRNKETEQSMLQSIVSTSDNSVRNNNNIMLTHQNSFKSEFYEQNQSPLNFLNFTSVSQIQKQKQ